MVVARVLKSNRKVPNYTTKNTWLICPLLPQLCADVVVGGLGAVAKDTSMMSSINTMTQAIVQLSLQYNKPVVW